jgi:hypothetical protein
LPCVFCTAHGKGGRICRMFLHRHTAKANSLPCVLLPTHDKPCAGHKTDGKWPLVFFFFSLLKFPIQPKITGIIFITSIIYSRTVSARCARPIKSALS